MRVPRATAACWVNGGKVPLASARLPVADPAVQAGFGLFETLAVRRGRPMELEQHLERLRQGADRLDLALPEPERLRAVAAEAASDPPLACGWLKIVVAGEGRWFVFSDTMDPAEEGQSASAVLLPWRRNPRDPLAGIKTLNYAPNLLGLDAARRRGADEGLWLNTRGHLAEGRTSNVFVVQGRKLFTPGERDGILAGVLRGLALRAARDLGLAVHEGKVRLRRLERAGEAFLTSSLRGVRPLVGFQGRPVGSGRPGPITRRIADEVARIRRAAEEPARPEAGLEGG